jgi:CheY-like chemotaxis protein
LLNLRGQILEILLASRKEVLRSAEDEGAPDLLISDYHLCDGELGTQVIAALRQRRNPASRSES